MAIDKTAFPVYQKMYRELYHIQKAINEESRIFIYHGKGLGSTILGL